MKHIAISIGLVALMLAVVPHQSSFSADKPKPPDFAGVFEGQDISLTLADHPRWPKIEYVGILITGKDQKVQAVKVRNDEVKGCHGVVYEGSVADQKAIELKIDGDTLSMRWYNGPTVTMKRVKSE